MQSSKSVIYVKNKVCQNMMNTEGLTISNTKYVKLLQAWIPVCIFLAERLPRTLLECKKDFTYITILTRPSDHTIILQVQFEGRSSLKLDTSPPVNKDTTHYHRHSTVKFHFHFIIHTK